MHQVDGAILLPTRLPMLPLSVEVAPVSEQRELEHATGGVLHDVATNMVRLLTRCVTD